MMAMPRARAAPNDRELVASIVEGKLEALGALFDRHEPALRRFVVRLGCSPSDADDLVQATFLEVPRAAQRFDDALAVKSWLFGLAAMNVRRHRRSLARAAANLVSWANFAQRTQGNSATPFENDLELRRVHDAFERLSPKKREVFALVVLEGVSGEQAARALGIPINTVWTRLHHARRELRAALGKDES
jgi:RNA polymerase sigma-70 factor (ECF subfamily)